MTRVSGDSWGYLPFSCGMWSFYSGFGWGWSPGLGACSPWWGGGLWVTNIGFGPPGYLPPRRPNRPPVHLPGKAGGRSGPYPLIPVNHRPASTGNRFVPRDRNVSVTIAGHVVMPVRPVSTRPVYDRNPPTYGSHFSPVAPGVRAPGGLNGAGGQPIGGSHAIPSRPVGSGAAPRMPQPSHPAPSAPHGSSPPPAPHPSGGGGGAPHGGGGGSPHH